MYECIYVFMYIHMYVCLFVCMYAWMYVRVFTCMYVSMCVCVYVRAYVARLYVCTSKKISPVPKSSSQVKHQHKHRKDLLRSYKQKRKGQPDANSHTQNK